MIICLFNELRYFFSSLRESRSYQDACLYIYLFQQTGFIAKNTYLCEPFQVTVYSRNLYMFRKYIG